MTRLDSGLIKEAKITAFNPRNVDRLVEEYERQKEAIKQSNIKKQRDWLAELHGLYNNHLRTLSNYVSGWTAGRESHQKNETSAIDTSNEQLVLFDKRLKKKLAEQDYIENKEYYDEKERRMDIARLIRDIGFYQRGNKRLFYEKLIELYYLDKGFFIRVCRQLDGEIAKNSKVAKLYKEESE